MPIAFITRRSAQCGDVEVFDEAICEPSGDMRAESSTNGRTRCVGETLREAAPRRQPSRICLFPDNLRGEHEPRPVGRPAWIRFVRRGVGSRDCGRSRPNSRVDFSIAVAPGRERDPTAGRHHAGSETRTGAAAPSQLRRPKSQHGDENINAKQRGLTTSHNSFPKN